MYNLERWHPRYLFYGTVGSLAVRTNPAFLTFVDDTLEGRRSRQDVRPRTANSPERRLLFAIRNQYPTARLADALQYVQRVLDEANVKHREGQADVSVMTGAVHQLALARGAR